MKKLFLFAAVVLSTQFTFGQSVNGVHLSELDASYIEMHIPFRGISNYGISIDYGQNFNVLNLNKRRTVYVDAKPIVVRSTQEAVKLMNKYGYVLKNVINPSSTIKSERIFVLVKEDI